MRPHEVSLHNVFVGVHVWSAPRGNASKNADMQLGVVARPAQLPHHGKFRLKLAPIKTSSEHVPIHRADEFARALNLGALPQAGDH